MRFPLKSSAQAVLAVVLALAASLAAATRGSIVAEPETLFVVPGGDEGCWVSFFAEPGFLSPSAQLTGRSYIESFEPEPVVEPDLRYVGGQPFLATVGSLVVGPNAELVGYEEPWFRHPELVLGPGRHVPDLEDIDFHRRVSSLKVFCVPAEERNGS